jgi:hypothetical protein
MRLSGKDRLRETPKKSPKYIDPAVPTNGEIFPDGTVLDLVQGVNATDAPRLLVWDGRRAKVLSAFEYSGKIYVPASISTPTLRAIRLPKRIKPYGSTGHWFMKAYLRYTIPICLVQPAGRNGTVPF